MGSSQVFLPGNGDSVPGNMPTFPLSSGGYARHQVPLINAFMPRAPLAYDREEPGFAPGGRKDFPAFGRVGSSPLSKRSEISAIAVQTALFHAYCSVSVMGASGPGVVKVIEFASSRIHAMVS